MYSGEKGVCALMSNQDFASNLVALEEIIKAMETGKLSLEEMLEKYASGVDLLKICKEQLLNAEGKVEELSKSLIENQGE